jgi:hypothetical protein
VADARHHITDLDFAMARQLSDPGGPQPGAVKWPGVWLTSMLK